MPDTSELRVGVGGDGPTAPSHGAVLMARLHAVALEVSDLLPRLGHVRPGPPITSQDRRRVAVRADLSTATLDRVCQDLDAWITQHANDEDRVATARTNLGGEPAAANSLQGLVECHLVVGSPGAFSWRSSEVLDWSNLDLTCSS